MAVLPIVRYPDSRLKTPADRVERFDADLRRLADDLLDTVRAAPGIGITAPHVGIGLRVVVLDLPGDQVRALANPTVTWSSEETTRQAEGSVSLPGIVDEVVRPERVRVAFQDLDGRDHTLSSDGLLSVCLQHEIDQLDGVFWLQRLSRLRRGRILKRIAKGDA
ncbi:peptide deformylase [Chthonobacter rhizosphaerae]|uniref:peptide deformylase n=1 Tax=Chthonobacter rhizosphaerae TaxID=2735553 RepID=UPI0015EE42CF|nr:peptide deformylase [Chthonobacter rhizosphaerae]